MSFLMAAQGEGESYSFAGSVFPIASDSLPNSAAIPAL